MRNIAQHKAHRHTQSRPIEVFLVALYAFVWTFLVAYFHLATIAEMELGFGYELIVYYIVLPVLTFIVSFAVGGENMWGKNKWMVALVLGVLFALVPFVTSNIHNFLSGQADLQWIQWQWIINGAIISILGMTSGTVMRWFNVHGHHA